jgi:hypothetical protein
VKIPNLKVGGAKFDMLLNELEIMKKANNPHVAMFMGACHDMVSSSLFQNSSNLIRPEEYRQDFNCHGVNVWRC